MSSRACCLFFSFPSSTISASVKNIFGQNKAPPSSSRTPAASRYSSQRKKGRRRQRVFWRRGGGGGGDVGSKLWLGRNDGRANRRGEVEVVEIDSFPLSTSRSTSPVFRCVDIVKTRFAQSGIGSRELSLASFNSKIYTRFFLCFISSTFHFFFGLHLVLQTILIL